MQIFSELRYPSRWYTKILMVLLALAFFALLAISAIAGFLVYRIVKPQRSSGEISLSSFPGRPEIEMEEHRLNSSHSSISYAVFCLKKKKKLNIRLLY